jgi:hypothetical protein
LEESIIQINFHGDVKRLVYEVDDVSADFWRDNTRGLCCWLDTEPFIGPIYSYPIRREHNVWIVRGVFCSLHCVKRYIIDNCFMNTSVFTLFSLMCLQLYNQKDEIIPAPQCELLRKFSISTKGLSLDDFRSAGPKSLSIRIVNPPIFPFKFEKSYICEQNMISEASAKQDEGYCILHKSNGISSISSISSTTTQNDISTCAVYNKDKKLGISQTKPVVRRKLTNLIDFFPVDDVQNAAVDNDDEGDDQDVSSDEEYIEDDDE